MRPPHHSQPTSVTTLPHWSISTSITDRSTVLTQRFAAPLIYFAFVFLLPLLFRLIIITTIKNTKPEPFPPLWLHPQGELERWEVGSLFAHWNLRRKYKLCCCTRVPEHYRTHEEGKDETGETRKGTQTDVVISDVRIFFFRHLCGFFVLVQRRAVEISKWCAAHWLVPILARVRRVKVACVAFFYWFNKNCLTESNVQCRWYAISRILLLC